MTCHLLQELLKNEDGARLRTYLRGTQLRPLFAVSSRRATRWRRSWRKFYWDESFLTETKTAWGAGWLLILSGMRETCLQHLQAFYVARGQTLNVIKEKNKSKAPREKVSAFDGDYIRFFFVPDSIWAHQTDSSLVVHRGDIGSKIYNTKKRQTPRQTSFRSSTYRGSGHVPAPVCNFSQSYFD
jgi:hypothetical protein